MSLDFAMIHKPRRATEFERQAELYGILKSLGRDVRGEVRAKFQGVGSQFDLVVFEGKFPVIIIEVKDTPHKKVIKKLHTRQARKYLEYGIPVIYYTSITPLQEVLSTIEGILESL